VTAAQIPAPANIPKTQTKSAAFFWHENGSNRGVVEGLRWRLV